jgi:membrane-associated phospholipid phosphatase
MRLQVLVLTACLGLSSTALQGQADSVRNANVQGTPPRYWIVPVAVGISVAFDEEAREGALASHTRTLDHLARAVNPLGTAKRLVPAMAISFVGAVLTGNRTLEKGTLNTVAGYVASDLVESALKPIVGRERPHFSGNSRHFHPLTQNGDWHSFPSAHVAHITSIVEAVSEQTHSAPVSAVGDLLVALVGWDRVYEDQHWTSDVTATVAISSFVSGATVRWLERRWQRGNTNADSTRVPRQVTTRLQSGR